MKMVNIKQLDQAVPRVGLGCMGMSEFYGPVSTEQEARNVMDKAYELGVRLFDTADFYGDGENEKLLGRFLKTGKKDALVATKCGIVRSNVTLEDGNFRREYNGHPDYIQAACEKSLRRLGVECIDLFYLHRVDPKVTIEDSVGALADLVKAGKVKAIGLSEANSEVLKRANSVHPISALQSEYSLLSRHVEESILPTCRKLGITFIPYSPLGRGLVPPSRGKKRVDFHAGDFRATLERATPENQKSNESLFEALHIEAESLGISTYQLMLAWILAQGEDILPIPGCRKLGNLVQNVDAESADIPEPIISRLSSVFAPGTVSGGRYTVNRSVTENASEMT